MSSKSHDVPWVLVDYATKGLIDKGEGGELAARLLLITAYDNAAKNQSLKPGRSTPFYSDLVPLRVFLEELFGQDNYERVSKLGVYAPSLQAARSQTQAAATTSDAKRSRTQATATTSPTTRSQATMTPSRTEAASCHGFDI